MPIRFLVLALIALAVTVPIVRFIPRARSSRSFDLLLFGATALVAFLVAWLALGLAASGALAALSGLNVGDAPVLPALLGAIAGALLVNLSLWVIDRFAPPPLEAPEQEPEDDAG